ncbi:MAG: UbiX family flavin prenyltransferase [Candidatus Marinimicrobia bacterium]|nr:UbiX family flavin prenyltransferase [Candidatus Neomarinimicrobiota bacterium]MDD5582344.1 UbiX family flavin prenyltransferase [Candidatus Neomarinimicrobiota bacterium]
MMKPEKIVVAITGASGAPLADHFIKTVAPCVQEVHLMFSPIGQDVFCQEMAISHEDEFHSHFSKIKNIHLWDVSDFSAPFASGTGVADAMVIIPCSMKTLSAIAHGYSYSLIERAADVMLKEGRTLILVPRETPLNMIHLKNLIHAAHAGAIILPPMPAFYTNPQSIEDIKAYISGKIMDRLNLPHHLFHSWNID